MMTGIPIENSLWTAYLLTIFFVVAGFAVYNVLYRRVPDRPEKERREPVI